MWKAESLSALEAGCVCQLTWGRQAVTEDKKKLKKVGKHWVLLQIYSLREAVHFLVLTDKASKKKSRKTFAHWFCAFNRSEATALCWASSGNAGHCIPVCMICLHSVLGILTNSSLWRQMADLNLSSKVPEKNQRVKPKRRTLRWTGIRLRKQFKGLNSEGKS